MAQGVNLQAAKNRGGRNLLKLFQNYLSDRYQSVIIGGKKSSPELVKAGVPQGSVLGPLLFLIYINDITAHISSNIKLYADDTSLFIDVADPSEAARVLNNDLLKIKQWADRWLVTFSAAKTKLLTCSNRKINHPDIIFDNVVLPEIESHKHLGLILSNNLSWSEHIDSILKSVSPMIDVLTSLKYKLDRGSLEQIYFSFIRPKLEYGCHIWDNCTTSNSFALENIQVKVARIVTGARKGTSRELLLTELGWPTLGDRRKGFKLKALINIINKRSPPYLQSLLPARVGVDRPESRKANNFKSFKIRSEKFKNSFIPSAIALWSSLCDEQRSYVYCKELIQSYCSPLFLI